MTKVFEARSDCPICIALDIFGDKWSWLILREMMLYQKNTYGEFLKMEEKIATNILADRLLTLESAGIISKEDFPGNKARYFYKITPKGIDLIPMAMELVIWGAKYYSIKPHLQEVANMVRANKDEAFKQLAERLNMVTVPVKEKQDNKNQESKMPS